MNYIDRITDAQLKHRLSIAGAVEIRGPKWCGKTTSAKHFANSSIQMDVKENQDRFYLLPESIMLGEAPRLIDEWQDVPQTWDRARRIIDDSAQNGLYIFTGSATPGEPPSHSGAGRFSTMNMSTMTLLEMGKSSGAVSLRELFDSDSFKPVESSLDYRGVVELLCRGGWPGALQFCVEDVMQTTRDYITAVVEKDASKAAGINHDPTKLRLFLKSLARNSSTPARVATIQQDISSREGILISDKTLDSYMNALRKIYLLNEIPAFSKNLRSKTSMRIAPIRHFADVSLAVAALETDMAALTNDVETVGLLFESLAVHELCVYAQSLGATVYQYHDYAGFEVDAIVKLNDGRWGAIEIKLGTRDFDAAAKRLCELRDKAALAGNPPSFVMILTATSGASGSRDDGVHVVALDCLGV